MTETHRYGSACILHDSNELELERYVDDSDTILPFYRIPLTGEHLAAWEVSRLEGQGLTCKRLATDTVTPGVRRATRRNSQLVYYTVAQSSVTLVRQGEESLITLLELKDREQDFILHTIDLICDVPPQSKSV
jgi:hypothetical protein